MTRSVKRYKGRIVPNVSKQDRRSGYKDDGFVSVGTRNDSVRKRKAKRGRNL